MSLFLSLAILSLSATAAPISGLVYPRATPAFDTEIPALGPSVHSGSWSPRGPMTISKSSLDSSTSLTDSTSLMGTDLDTELSSTLRDLETAYPAIDSYLGSWVSSDDLEDYLGMGNLGQVIPATSLVVRAGEDLETWVSFPEGETTSQTASDLESSSWVLLDDLACGLTENAFVPIQSILVYQPDEPSNAAVYVSLTNPDSTLSTLPLDHGLDSFLYTDIPGVSSDLGLGSGSGAALQFSENPSSDLHMDAPAPAGSETDPLASNDDLETDANLTMNSTTDPLTSTSSSLDLDSDLADNSLNSSFDVDVASNPTDLNGPGVPACS